MPSLLKEPIPEATLAEADTRKQWQLVWLGYAFVVLLIARASWLGDDAYIGFRAISNLLGGNGPNFNIGERVQVYTYPLWFYLQTAFAWLSGGEYLLTIQALSILTMAAALFVLVRYVCPTPASAVLALAALAASKSFMDYTTSGLENPMNFLLAALFCHLALNQGRTFGQWRWLVLVAALAVLNRQDMALVFFPLLAYRLWMHIRRKEATFLEAAGSALLFSLPLWLWLGFSLVYYGYPFPNTYYAKLYTGIGSGAQLFQGMLFYLSTLQKDTLTLLVIGAGIGTAILSRLEDRLALAAGVVFYLFYIIKIGGDFMIGRFFSVPLFIAVILLVRYEAEGRYKLMAAAGALLMGLAVPNPTFTYGNDAEIKYDDVVDVRGIANERGYYYPATSLVQNVARAHGSPRHPWWDDALADRAQGKTYTELISIGFYGVAADPKMHIVDVAGLADPLLSHLPIPFDEANPQSWRVGHYVRMFPDGYRESLLQNRNLVTDPLIRPVYDDVRLITRGPIWSAERWQAIWRMNTGHYDAAIRQWDGGSRARWGARHPDDPWLNHKF